MIEMIGVPGAGKSSLAKLMSVRDNIPLLCEPVISNPYLESYYKDPAAYAFKMQVFLLHSMFEHTLKAKGQRCVMDASMNVNDIFVEVQHNTGIMSTRDYKVYRGLSESLRKLVTPPEIVVYLRCSPETAVKRIHTRGRSSELEVPFQYWCDLNDTYDYWYELYTSSKKMCLEVDNLDFISDTSEEDYALDCIFEYLET